MAKELTTIITAAAAVRDAIETGENTAERVEGFYVTSWSISVKSFSQVI